MDPEEHFEEDSDVSVESEDEELAEEERKKKAENCGSIDWKLRDFTSIKTKRLESDHFVAGKYKWVVLFFPKGNQYPGEISAYVAVRPDPGSIPKYGWNLTAKFSIAVINHKDDALTIRKSTKHRYTTQSKDWGFNQILASARACDPDLGFLDENGDLTVEVNVECLPETSLYGSGRFYLRWDSKKETGYVGLKNQGATCYMNSLLQSLYSLSTFRKAVYEMPTHTDEPTSSIPLALQRVFYNLQFSDNGVGTKELTKSFGWSTRDSFIQQDVQELMRVFCDNLEEKMKGTTSEGIVERLFQGKTTNYIRCVDVDFESKRQEPFLDLSLQVQGCKNIYESLEKYCAPERLEGDNQYQTEDYGYQDADKGCNFTELPPVLSLHLKRFVFDFERERNVKVNDKYEYPSLLRLGRFMHPDADKSIKYNYRLHCVMVHSGTVHGGHYYAFIRPKLKNRWFKFDDERVSKATTKQVFESCFGGEVPMMRYQAGRKTTVMQEKSANAYMLIYVRTSDREQILSPVEEEEIPGHLKERFEQEEMERLKRAQEQREAHLYTHVKVATVADMEKHHRCDLVSMEDLASFKVKKESSLKEFREILADVLNIPVERQRFWNWQGRRNQTVRPDEIYSPRDEEAPLAKILKKTDLKLFLEASRAPEDTTDPELLFPPVLADQCLLFLKFYDPDGGHLNFLTYTFVSTKSQVGELIPLVRERMGWKEDEEVLIFEEIKPSMIEKVDPTNTIKGAELGTGDILTFQLAPKGDYPHPLATDYYNYMLNRVTVEFRELGNPREEQFSLELAKNMKYDDVAAAVGKQLDCDPMKLRFTQHSNMTNKPRMQPVKRTEHSKLLDLLHNVYSRSKLVELLYYERLEVSIVELQTKKVIKVHWYNSKVEKVSTETLLLERSDHIADAMEQLKTRVPLEGSKQVRIMEVHNHKIYRTLKPEERITGVSELYTTLRGEEIPEDELEKEKGSERVQVVHISREGGRTHYFSDSFFFMLKKGEPFSDTKKRILAKLELTEEDVAKYKFAVVPSYYGKVTYIKDDTVLTDRAWYSTDTLALEHADKSRPPRVSNVGIVIKG